MRTRIPSSRFTFGDYPRTVINIKKMSMSITRRWHSPLRSLFLLFILIPSLFSTIVCGYVIVLLLIVFIEQGKMILLACFLAFIVGFFCATWCVYSIQKIFFPFYANIDFLAKHYSVKNGILRTSKNIGTYDLIRLEPTFSRGDYGVRIRLSKKNNFFSFPLMDSIIVGDFFVAKKKSEEIETSLRANGMNQIENLFDFYQKKWKI